MVPPAMSLSEIERVDGGCDVPIMLITSVGADSSKELEEFAAASVGKDKYTSLAMGGRTEKL